MGIINTGLTVLFKGNYYASDYISRRNGEKIGRFD